MQKNKILAFVFLGMSSFVFADQAAFENKNIGIVGQAECDTKTGNGFAEIKNLRGKTLVSTWYKVKSEHLCGRAAPHPIFIGNFSSLVALGATNSYQPTQILSKLIIDENGYLTSLVEVGSVDSKKLTNIDGHEHIHREETIGWYFKTKSIKREK